LARTNQGPHGFRVSRFVAEGLRFAVISLPNETVPDRVDRLTPAERAVTSLLLGGLSNAEIAAKRGTSERTVANQIAAIFRKLGVSSRTELVTRDATRRSTDVDTR
jgi:DNA-binding NarL/FixJ family response regulator